MIWRRVCKKVITLGKRQKGGCKNRFPTRAAYVLAMQRNLMQRALATWPRRYAPLLEVNCGDGYFLPMLWQSGFEAVATEQDDSLRILAEKRNLPDIDVRASADVDLPFEDDTFDWVILHLRPSRDTEIGDSAREALRVARRGLMVTFWNSLSLPGIMSHIFRKGRPWPYRLSWWQVWRQLHTLGDWRHTTLATLCGPMATWSGRCRASFINGWSCGLPIGAWCIIRMDLNVGYPLTSMPLRIGKTPGMVEPVLEYSQKNLSSNCKSVTRL